MKFIREIIGEKRQMDAALRQGDHFEPAAAAPSEQDAGTSAGLDEVTAPQDYEAFAGGDLDTLLAEDARHDIPEASLAEPAPEAETPTLAEHTPPPEAQVQTQEDDADTVQETYSVTAELDRALVPDHDPNTSLENVFRALKQDAEPASEEVEKPASEDVAMPTMSSETAPDATVEETVAAPEAPPVADEPVNAPVAETPAPPVTAPQMASAQAVEVPQPALGRGVSRHGRVKTRLLGFNASMDRDIDPLSGNNQASTAVPTSFPVGWLVVVEGAGKGSAFTLFSGVSTIGRGENQTVPLSFGDSSISRENHASIAYDPRHKGFFIGHGGKANIVRLNDRPVLSTESLSGGDHITIGETTMRFIPFCGPEFSWEDAGQTERMGEGRA